MLRVMVVESCPFDPLRDLQPVEPFGAVDLKDAYVNHCVPSVPPGAVEDYNGIDDPASIVGKPSDIFDAIRMRDEISSSDGSNGKIDE